MYHGGRPAGWLRDIIPSLPWVCPADGVNLLFNLAIDDTGSNFLINAIKSLPLVRRFLQIGFPIPIVIALLCRLYFIAHPNNSITLDLRIWREQPYTLARCHLESD
jgi:hypothetical protein